MDDRKLDEALASIVRGTKDGLIISAVLVAVVVAILLIIVFSPPSSDGAERPGPNGEVAGSSPAAEAKAEPPPY